MKMKGQFLSPDWLREIQLEYFSIMSYDEAMSWKKCNENILHHFQLQFSN